MKKRKTKIVRKTRETQITLELDLNGTGKTIIECPLGFWSHMLNLLSFFSGFDLTVKAAGDVEIDDHHLVEDLGICLGEALKKALGDRAGIRRFGSALVPMDETLVQTVVDISGRPFLGFNIPIIRNRKEYSLIENLQEFCRGFSNHAGVNLHFVLFSGENTHHICEAVFKSLGLALKDAVKRERRGVSSTKGKFD